MRRLLVVCVVCLAAFLAAPAFGQAPLLQISGVDGQRQLKNIHTIAATAWFAQFVPVQSVSPATPQPTEALVAFTDLLPFPSQAPIAPGGTFRWKPPAEGRDFKIVATLYEDGSMAGDARLISRLLDVRQFVYNDAADNLRYLDEFQTRQQKDLEVLRAEFRLRSERHNALLHEKLGGPPRIIGNVMTDMDCNWILRTVEKALRGEDKFVPLRFKPILWARYAALGASRPALAEAAAPGGWTADKTAAGEGPPVLGLSWRQDDASGLIEIRLHNAGTSAVTAYVYEFELLDGTKMWSRGDLALRPGTPYWRPGASDFHSMLGHFTNTETKQQFRSVKTIRSSATIYEDGTTAGDGDEVERLLARRRILFSSIPQALAAIRAAREKPDDPGALAPITACATASAERLLAVELGAQEDIVCRPLAVALQRGTVSSSEALGKHAGVLEQVYARLKESKPPLTEASIAAPSSKAVR